MSGLDDLIRRGALQGIAIEQWGSDAYRVQVWDLNFNGIVGLVALVGMVETAEANAIERHQK